jgi:Uma2 family endonuclease
MSAIVQPRVIRYPTTDHRPMAETDFHRDLMMATIQTLEHWFSANPKVYVSGNLLVYYVPGNKRKHVAPDVFVVFGVSKRKREYYLLWEERKAPSVVIEMTSNSTRHEDRRTKFVIYRDVLKVKEYILFDPRREHLDPRLQGFRLVRGQYVPIAPIDGRLPSKTLGLHLEDCDGVLRLWDPVTKQYLPTPAERAERAERSEQTLAERAERAERSKQALAEELQNLRQQLAKLREDQPRDGG